MLVLWLIIFAVSILVDLFVLSDFILLGFAIGALFAAASTYFNLGPLVESIIFASTSLISFIFIIPWARRLLRQSVPKFHQRETQWIGKEILIEEDIDIVGKIKVDGIYWSATVNSPLKKGDMALITGLEGNKFILEKVSRR